MSYFTCFICKNNKLLSSLRLISQIKWNTQICIDCCPKKNSFFLKEVLDRRYPNASLPMLIEAIKVTDSLNEAEKYLESNYKLCKRVY